MSHCISSILLKLCNSAERLSYQGTVNLVWTAAASRRAVIEWTAKYWHSFQNKVCLKKVTPFVMHLKSLNSDKWDWSIFFTHNHSWQFSVKEKKINFEIAALFHHIYGEGKSAAISKLESYCLSSNCTNTGSRISLVFSTFDRSKHCALVWKLFVLVWILLWLRIVN